MITSEDSKIRILDGLEVVQKYKGIVTGRNYDFMVSPFYILESISGVYVHKQMGFMYFFGRIYGTCFLISIPLINRSDKVRQSDVCLIHFDRKAHSVYW